MSVVGARPQFIKLAPLSREIRKEFDEVIVHSGQHFSESMSALFFSQLRLPQPDYHLELDSTSSGARLGEMINNFEHILKKEQPDAVIVFGDTDTTLAGALAASMSNIPIAHVEAGLRSFNRMMPEERNRVLVDHCSDLLFAPTPGAVENLAKEGLHARTILTGDIMVDALEQHLEQALEDSSVLQRLQIGSEPFILLTLHRQSTVDNPEVLSHVLHEMGKVDEQVIFPVHPRTHKTIDSAQIRLSQNIRCIDPQGYLDFLVLQNTSLKIVTDSGGIQKEAYLLGKPCITVRTETEWVETVDAGWNVLVNPASCALSDSLRSFAPSGERPKVYGSNVAQKMVDVLQQFGGLR